MPEDTDDISAQQTGEDAVFVSNKEGIKNQVNVNRNDGTINVIFKGVEIEVPKRIPKKQIQSVGEKYIEKRRRKKTKYLFVTVGIIFVGLVLLCTGIGLYFNLESLVQEKISTSLVAVLKWGMPAPGGVVTFITSYPFTRYKAAAKNLSDMEDHLLTLEGSPRNGYIAIMYQLSYNKINTDETTGLTKLKGLLKK